MKFRRTTIITLTLLSFLGGLGYAKTGNFISYELVASISIFYLITIIRLNRLALIASLLLGFSLGWLRGQIYMQNVLRIEALDNIKATAIVTATSDTFYNSRGQMSFDANNLQIIEPNIQKLPGKILVSGFGVPTVYKGDILRITGKFYQTRGSRQLGMSFAKIELLDRNMNAVDNLRRKFSAGLSSAVPEPEASFGLGLLIGQRTTIPDKLTEQLSAVGLTHIIAVSGYNLTIIIRAVRRMLSQLSKYQSTLLSLGLIAIFLLMTGLSASIVRAAIVSGLSILAWYYGRSFKPILLLSLTAVITAGSNPFYLWSDIGWYLSFLAFFGVLVIAPLISMKIFKNKKPKILGQVMLESFSALIMTIPLVLFIFKQISLVALPANLIVVPMVPIAMLLSLIAGIGGMIAVNIAGLIAWPATVFMTAMLDIVRLFSKVPHALATVGISLISMIFMYLVIIFITIVMWRANSKNGKITDVKVEL